MSLKVSRNTCLTSYNSPSLNEALSRELVARRYETPFSIQTGHYGLGFYMSKVAMPAFRPRIAPVLDSCIRVLVIHMHHDGQTEKSELHPSRHSPVERVSALKRAGVTTTADQIATTGAKVVLAPCHNCHCGLEDIVSHYRLGTHVMFISDILYEVIKKPQ